MFVQGKGEKGIEAAKDEVSKSKESQGRNKGKGEEDNDDEDGRSDDDEKDGRERSSSCSKDSGGEEESGGQMMDPVRLEEDEDVDEDDWRPTTKQKKLDQQDKKSHPVHAPFFPEVVNFAVMVVMWHVLYLCGMDKCLGACVYDMYLYL